MSNVRTTSPSGHPRRWVIAVTITIVVLMIAGLARAYWSQVYGPKVTYEAVVSYIPDGQRLQLNYSHGSCDTPAKAEVVEQSDERVVVAITAWTSPGPCTMEAISGTLPASLSQPLGSRSVYYDTGDGYRPAPLGPMPLSPHGIRGVALKEAPCPWHPQPAPQPAGSSVRTGTSSIVPPWVSGRVRPVTGKVAEWWICPWQVQRPSGLARPTVVTPDFAPYRRLLTALRLPSKPPVAICTLEGIVQPLVVARTDTGYWVVKVPHDGCGRPLPAVQRAIHTALPG